jgi:hypothetical protein
LAKPLDDTVSAPPLLTLVPVVTPRTVVKLPVTSLKNVAPITVSLPPARIVEPLAVPPEETNSLPPLLTTVLLVTPPEEMYSKPPLPIVVPDAVPPWTKT